MSAIEDLLAVVARLRDPEDGCPWDLQQDHSSMRGYLIEEAHEVVEAIDEGRDAELCEELGDLLVQVVIHAQFAREEGRFDFEAVARGIADKLVRRHPDVFQDDREREGDAQDVLRNWEQIKKAEKSKESILDGLPPSLPALLRAYRVQEKASIVGFDWEEAGEVIAKVREEVDELADATEREEPHERLEEEFGDLLFSLVNLARHLRINAEVSLSRSTRKFISRFQDLERRADAQGRTLDKMTLEEMDSLWTAAKHNT